MPSALLVKYARTLLRVAAIIIMLASAGGWLASTSRDDYTPSHGVMQHGFTTSHLPQEVVALLRPYDVRICIQTEPPIAAPRSDTEGSTFDSGDAIDIGRHTHSEADTGASHARPDRYRDYVARTLSTMTAAYANSSRSTAATDEFMLALDIYRCLSGIDPVSYQVGLLATLHELTTFYMSLNMCQEAEQPLAEAIMLHDKLIARGDIDRDTDVIGIRWIVYDLLIRGSCKDSQEAPGGMTKIVPA